MHEDDDFDDHELPDPSDMDQDDYTVMSRCPHCKKMIDEQSEVCPRCGNFISVEDTPQKQSLWVVILIVLMLLTVVIVYLE